MVPRVRDIETIVGDHDLADPPLAARLGRLAAGRLPGAPCRPYRRRIRVQLHQRRKILVAQFRNAHPMHRAQLERRHRDRVTIRRRIRSRREPNRAAAARLVHHHRRLLDDWFGLTLPFTTAGAVLAETFVALPFLVLGAEAAQMVLTGVLLINALSHQPTVWPLYLIAALSAGAMTVLASPSLVVTRMTPEMRTSTTLSYASCLHHQGKFDHALSLLRLVAHDQRNITWPKKRGK